MDITDVAKLLKTAMLIFLYLLLNFIIYVYFYLTPIKHGYDTGKGCLNVSKCLTFNSNGENISGVFLWIACEGVINI